SSTQPRSSTGSTSGTTGTTGSSGTGGAGSGGGGGGAGGGTVDQIDGRILFRGLGEGIAFEVDLYAEPVSAPAAITRGDGHCDVHATGEGDSFVGVIPPGTLDLGASVTAKSGALTFDATVDGTTGGFSYIFTQAGVDAFDKTWTLTNAGSASGLAATTLATVHVPAAVVPIVPTPGGGSIETTGGKVTLQWTGGEGADSFHINIMSSKAEVDCYPAPSATSFDLPAEVVSALDPIVVPAVWAESVSLVPVGGRRIWVRVTSDNLD
ncbi:MAG: hypothetical protein U0359_10125, partial [Byssovorax sp.]